MIDCGITTNFLKEWERMCVKFDKVGCAGCPLLRKDPAGIVYSCRGFTTIHPQDAQEIVQKWSDEHPLKTRKDVFLEKFPKALLRGTGAPLCCAKRIGIAPNKDCMEKSCVDCWNEPYEE